jgi:quercetin dioxygenase-like cupin family protein
MKINPYTQAQATHFASEAAKGIAARVVIGKSVAANNFCMRVFEIAPGGHTPKHSHDWEHEMFIHAGEGEVYGNERWNPIASGTVVFMPGNEEHQLRNTGKELLVVVCVIPGTAPEL